MAVAAPLWAAEPIKVPLVPTAIPDKVDYLLPPFASVNMQLFSLSEEHPTKTLVLGGVECTVRAEVLAKIEGGAKGGRDGKLSYKLIIKTPTQELTFPESRGKPLELTLDKGRKYFLTGYAYHCITDAADKSSVVGCQIQSATAQTGKIGKTETPIALIDSNFPGPNGYCFDGFYTPGEDNIAIGLPESIEGFRFNRYHLVQPFSKYISTPGGIFEIQKVARDGSELTVLPYAGATANVEVSAPQKYSGQIVLTSSDAGLNATVKAGESASVIPGSYTVMGAVLSESNSLLIISGEGMPPLKLEVGAKQKLVLSGPKALEFQAGWVGGKVNIKPETLKMKGQAGETYEQVDYDQKNPPEVYLTVDGKMVLLGKMAFG